MKVDGKSILLRILAGFGYTAALVLGYFIFNILLFQAIPPVWGYMNQSLINLFVIVLAGFTFASGFLRGTIFKYFVEGGRDLFIIGLIVYAISKGPLSLTVQNIRVEIDATFILTLFLLATSIDLARTMLSALNYLVEKEKL